MLGLGGIGEVHDPELAVGPIRTGAIVGHVGVGLSRTCQGAAGNKDAPGAVWRVIEAHLSRIRWVGDIQDQQIAGCAAPGHVGIAARDKDVSAHGIAGAHLPWIGRVRDVDDVKAVDVIDRVDVGSDDVQFAPARYEQVADLGWIGRIGDVDHPQAAAEHVGIVAGQIEFLARRWQKQIPHPRGSGRVGDVQHGNLTAKGGVGIVPPDLDALVVVAEVPDDVQVHGHQGGGLVAGGQTKAGAAGATHRSRLPQAGVQLERVRRQRLSTGARHVEGAPRQAKARGLGPHDAAYHGQAQAEKEQEQYGPSVHGVPSFTVP